jgi:transcriptional regulator with XRE-family HTH domain
MNTPDVLSEAFELQRLRRALPNPARRRLIRESHGLSQEVVAQAVGVTRATLCRWELGLREPRDRNLVRYSEVLGRLA